MKSTSTIYPDTVQPGKIRKGVVTCFVTWDIVEKQIPIDDETTQTVWEHECASIDWTLDDAAYLERVDGKLQLTEAGQQYFIDNADEIVKWAKPAVL